MTAPAANAGDGAAAPRRLLAVSPSGARGGAEGMLLRAVQAAASDGWSVRCLAPAGPLAEQLRAAGVRVDRIPPLTLASGSKVLAVVRLLWATLRTSASIGLAGRGADVVLANGLMVLPALRLLPRRARRVWWAHDVLVRRDRLTVARALSRSVDVVVGVSEAVLEPLRGNGVALRLVRNGVDVSDLRASPPSGSTILVGCNAALTPWKGQHVLLEALARLARPDVHLELLGAAPPKDADHEAALRRRADRPDLAGRVHFLGHVLDPLSVMRRWHVGVSASVDPEASGLAFLEGLSLGLPQVVTGHGGPAEVLGEAGVLADPGDPDSLAAGLAALLDDPERWLRCASAGPVVAAAVAHRPTQERALLAVLEGTAARGGGWSGSA